MKNLEYYLKMKYPIEIVEEDDGQVVASIPDLPGCASFGESADEAIRAIHAAKKLWIETKLEGGEHIPEPTVLDDYSGKFVIRIPRGLHRSLDFEARQQGISLNQFVNHVLSERHSLAALEAECRALVREHSPCVTKRRHSPNLGWKIESVNVRVDGAPITSSSTTWRVGVPGRGHLVRQKATLERRVRCH